MPVKKSHTPLHERGINPEYEVGYGKPPRPKKGGPSPNPYGRAGKPKKETMAEVLKRVDDMPVEITKNNKKHKVTGKEATIIKIRNDGLKGNMSAARLYLELMDEHVAAPAKSVQEILSEEMDTASRELDEKLIKLGEVFGSPSADVEDRASGSEKKDRKS